MATANSNSYGVEKRHILDRRANGSHASTTHKLTAVDWIALTLLIVGGINWGLVGLFNFDLVAEIFGPGSAVSRVVYVLVGLSALYTIFTATKMGSKSDS